MTRVEKYVMWFSILLGVTWITYRLLSNSGWILDDEVSHYLFSKSVWENPDQLFNHWTRPGRNFIHLFIAPLGFTETRIFTFILALFATSITYKVGKLLEIRALWSVPMLLLFQSWFPELSYPILTQTPFMLFWILGVWLGMTKRWHLAGFCFGYLSLIRHEGILITGIWGLWVTFSEGGFGRHCLQRLKGEISAANILPALGRDALYGVSTVSAIFAYNLAAFIIQRSIPFMVYFESKPTTMYGSGTIYHYVPLYIGGVGLTVFILSLVGSFRIRKRLSQWSLLLATFPVYFILHSLIYWKGAFASGGYYHFLMPMAPFVALLAAEGVSQIQENVRDAWRVPVLATISIFIVFQGLNMAHHQVVYQDWEAIMKGEAEPEYQLIAKPLEQGTYPKIITEASRWASDQYPDRIILAKHIAHNFHQRTTMTKERERNENLPLYQMELGTIYIWDGKYCEHENRIKHASFHESQDWKRVKAWPKRFPGNSTAVTDQFDVIIFEKVSKLDTQDKVYAELGEADKYDQAYGAAKQ
ncbi:hypothetical protein [Rubritalea tangerina]|uniref:Glycosyltransferase RgtA/B/C/D-like domain-containing protein n=1 Tax=Rubritalea tangerina TaxID=430798 RepID=A0ABW4Z9I7_9BACT